MSRAVKVPQSLSLTPSPCLPPPRPQSLPRRPRPPRSSPSPPRQHLSPAPAQPHHSDPSSLTPVKKFPWVQKLATAPTVSASPPTASVTSPPPGSSCCTCPAMPGRQTNRKRLALSPSRKGKSYRFRRDSSPARPPRQETESGRRRARQPPAPRPKPASLASTETARSPSPSLLWPMSTWETRPPPLWTVGKLWTVVEPRPPPLISLSSSSKSTG